MATPSQSADPRRIWVRFLLYPTHTLPTAAAPVILAAALAARDQIFSPWVVLAVLIGSWSIHVGGVLADNHELLRRDGEVPEHPELLQALAAGDLSLGQLRWAILACLALGAAPAPWLYAIGGPPVLIIGGLGVLSSICYAMSPLRYARFGLADPIFLLMFGVVAVVGTYYIQLASAAGQGQTWVETWRQIPWQVWIVGLPVGALITNVLIIDDIRDRDFDSRKGWRTTAVRFGLAGSRVEFVVLAAFAYLAPLGLWLGGQYSAWILLPWISLLELVSITRQVLQHDTTAALLRMTPRTSRLALVFSLLLAAAVWLG